MIEMKKFIEDVLKPEFAKMEKEDPKYDTVNDLIKKGETKLDEHLKEICKDHNELLKFAYELRRQDCEVCWINKYKGDKLDRFTKLFLYNTNMVSEVMFDIIMSNQWWKHEGEMRPRQGYDF
jgi:hypothetical protein